MTLSERDAINRYEGFVEGFTESMNEYAETKTKAIQELLEKKQITPEIASLLLSVVQEIKSMPVPYSIEDFL